MSVHTEIVDNIRDIFANYQNDIDTDHGLRQTIRNVCYENDRLCKEIFCIMQAIHESEEAIPIACQKAKEMLKKAKEGYKNLLELVPLSDYFKYNDHWRYTTQRYCFLISLIILLEDGQFAQHQTVANELGMEHADAKTGFHVDLEDYLYGILMLCSELARLVVNSASRGQYSRAMRASMFIKEVNTGFRLMNLKNDFLRKRYDSLKYDVKKIEEVVYDLSIRGLLLQEEDAGAGDLFITSQPSAPASEVITSQPGEDAAASEVITSQPGADAAASEVITSQPGEDAAAAEVITSQPGADAAASEVITSQPATDVPASKE